MRVFRPVIILSVIFSLFATTFFSAGGGASAQQAGNLSGRVVDTRGDAVANARVTVADKFGSQKHTITDRQGRFAFYDLIPGIYTVQVTAPNFKLHQETDVEVLAVREKKLSIHLAIEDLRADVEVQGRDQLDTDPSTALSTLKLSESDLDGLPDDPDELELALRALAGDFDEDSEFSVDGFSGGRIPRKASIRAVRINRTPFSAENERIGFGGIEIFTKAGSDKFRANSSFRFNDSRLNSRAPFAATRIPSQTRNILGGFSGPLKKNKSSFYVDMSTSQTDQEHVVNATVLDASHNIVQFREGIASPTRNIFISPRIDYQINKDHTLAARFGFFKNSSVNLGVADLSLPSRAFNASGTGYNLNLTETAVINPRTVNETRFALWANTRRTEGDNSIPTINVAGAFMGGGSQIGLNYNNSRRFELQNYTTTVLGKQGQHALKFGGRLRSVSLDDRSESNFGGIFTFAGVRDPLTGALLFSSIEQYRQKLLGNPDPRFNPNQFSISAGDPMTDISQRDIALFVMDDWRLRRNLTVGVGLRFENQTNISDHTNFAPRFGIAWSPDGGGKMPAKTVIRGGLGVFYARLNESFFLQARRFNGVRQTQYIVGSGQEILSQPVFTLGGVTNVPVVDQLSAFARTASFTVRRLADDLRAPMTYQAAITLDRRLPMRTSVSISFYAGTTSRSLGSLNVNAPFCPPLADCPDDAVRPFADEGNIYQYESLGVSKQRQLVVNFNSNAIRRMSVGGNYRLGSVTSNSDGMGSFPAYSHDLSGEFGPSSMDVRHMFSMYGSVRMPWKVQLSPFITLSSGRPFNITTGVDSNRDSIFNERPTYAQLRDACDQNGLVGGFCSFADMPGMDATLIPRNFGRGPATSSVNLSVNRAFILGGSKDARRTLNFGLQASNVLNRTNPGTPIGNLSSDRFGRPYSSGNYFGSGGNRRIQLQIRFNF